MSFTIKSSTVRTSNRKSRPLADVAMCVAASLLVASAASAAPPEPATTNIQFKSAAGQQPGAPVVLPAWLTPGSEVPRPTAATLATALDVNTADYVPQQNSPSLQSTIYQSPFADDANGQALPAPNGPITAPNGESLPQPMSPENPCAAVIYRPINQLGINIGTSEGDLPTNQAASCWDTINQGGGTCPTCRCWPTYVYNWDATCLCHRPLYFEEINLERYGYECDCCLQPAASAAHFFGTFPMLPYCIAVECPGECIYTLGHYRPGSCPPWRWHWPPCDPLAAASAGGIWTGLIFLIP